MVAVATSQSNYMFLVLRGMARRGKVSECSPPEVAAGKSVNMAQVWRLFRIHVMNGR